VDRTDVEFTTATLVVFQGDEEVLRETIDV
jgi:hypothetical protein